MTAWIITGCSSGLGRALAQAVLAAGHDAVLTARDADSVRDLAGAYPDTALACALDVTDGESVARTVRDAEARFGSIDVLVNNAGYGYRAAVEEGEADSVGVLFATNFFGPVALIKAVLPGMRRQGSGAIVNVSSIAGRRAAPGSGYYSASKFALEGMSDALRKEVGPLGIKVIVVEPGAFRTDFAGRSLTQSQVVIDDYADTAGRRRKENDHSHGTQQGDPARAARAIMDMVATPDGPFRLALGSDAVAIIREENGLLSAELAKWEAVSCSTDFPARA